MKPPGCASVLSCIAMPRRLEFFALPLLAFAVLLPRLWALDAFITVDESTWLMRSADFYYALTHRDFEKTVYAYHPAVTTMWIGTAGMLLDFPEYRVFQQGYFYKEWRFFDFLREHGHGPLSFLYASRLVQVGIVFVLYAWLYYLTRRLTSWPVAALGVAFLAFDPFLLGHTRILAHEGVMSLLLLIALLACLNYLRGAGGGWGFLLLSGAAAGAAVLTKSSASLIVPFTGLLLLLRDAPAWPRAFFRRVFWPFLLWLGVAVLVFVLLWPGMWVAPKQMLHEVYGNALSYAFQGYNLSVQRPEDVQVQARRENGLALYANEIFWRLTPSTWVGLFVLGWALLRRGSAFPEEVRRLVLALFLFGVLFYLMMGTAQGRRASHYIMATYAVWSLAAGIALAWAGLRFRLGRLPRRVNCYLLGGLLLLQAGSAWSFAPYYINYFDPLVEALQPGIQTPAAGSGEGLELAAAYLASTHPHPENLTVLAWWGSPFAFYFPGATEHLYPTEKWNDTLVERLEKSDYLVVYYYHQLRRNIPVKLMREIKDLPPEHTIRLHGVEFVRIYRVEDLPPSLFVPDE